MNKVDSFLTTLTLALYYTLSEFRRRKGRKSPLGHI